MDNIAKIKSCDHCPEWVRFFPELCCQQDSGLQDILNYGSSTMALKKGSWAFREGDDCASYVLLLEGSIRVQNISAEGRELMLYRFSGGEGCTASAACLIADKPFTASAICETHAVVVTMNKSIFMRGLEQSDCFRDFVLKSFGKQCKNFAGLISDVAFEPLNLRLARRLLADKDQNGIVHKTHTGLATEMGSVREVISRELNSLRDKGWVELNRGYITIIDNMALSSWVKSSSQAEE